MKEVTVEKRGENRKGLAYVMDRRADAYDRRQANAKKRQAFCAGAYRLDEPYKGTEGDDEREDRLLSDGGRGAALIRLVDETPEWQREVNRVLDTLEGVELRIAEAFLDERRPARVAKIAGTNRVRVYRTMAKLRNKLALALALYRRSAR